MFTNEPIDAAQLPQLDHADFWPVDPSYRRASLIAFGVVAVATIVARILAVLLVDRAWVAVVTVAAILVLLGVSAVVRVLAIARMGFQLREHDLSHRKGLFVREVSTVPFVRVQHARIHQGPVDRLFGLATLEINSAGPDLTIHGLSTATADQLKAAVVERAGDLTEEP